MIKGKEYKMLDQFVRQIETWSMIKLSETRKEELFFYSKKEKENIQAWEARLRTDFNIILKEIDIISGIRLYLAWKTRVN